MITRKVMQSSHKTVTSSSTGGGTQEQNSVKQFNKVFSGDVPDSSWITSAQSQQNQVACQDSIQGHPQPPTVVKHLAPLNGVEGQDAVFEANISGNPQPRISWFKDEQPLQPSEHLQMFYEDDGKATLVIKQATPADVGNYFALAENQYGRLQTGANLFFPTGGAVSSVNMSSITSGNMGGLDLNALGMQFPGMDTTQIQQMMQQSIQQSQQMVNQQMQSVQSIEPQYAPPPQGTPPTIIGAPAIIASAEHRTACIEMTFAADPLPEVKWYKDGVEMVQSSKHSLTTNGQGTFTLIINEVDMSDQGKYTCVADNPVGGTQINVGLQLSARPPPLAQYDGPPPAITNAFRDCNIEEGANLVLHCDVVPEGPPVSFQWYKNQQYITESNRVRIVSSAYESTLYIDNAHSTDSGMIGVVISRQNCVPTTHESKVTITPSVISSLGQTFHKIKIIKQEQSSDTKPVSQPIVMSTEFKKEAHTTTKTSETQAHQQTVQQQQQAQHVQHQQLQQHTQHTQQLNQQQQQSQQMAQQQQQIHQHNQQTQQFTQQQQPQQVAHQQTVQQHTQQQQQQFSQQHQQQHVNTSAPGATGLPKFTETFPAQIEDQGTRVVLKCAVVPQATAITFQWAKDGQPLNSGNPYRIETQAFETVLYIDNLKPEDAGQFSCTASGTGGTNTHKARVDSKQAVVAGQGPGGLPVFTERFPAQILTGGHPLVLNCKVKPEASPVKLVWTKDGKPLAPGQPYRIETQPFETTLFIDHLKPEDFGEYSVIATNAGGSNTHKAPIKQGGGGAPPQGPPLGISPNDLQGVKLKPTDGGHYSPPDAPPGAPPPPGPPPAPGTPAARAPVQQHEAPPGGIPKSSKSPFVPSVAELTSIKLKPSGPPNQQPPLGGDVNFIQSQPKQLPPRLPGVAPEAPPSQRFLPLGQGKLPFDPRELELVELRHVKEEENPEMQEAVKEFDPPQFLSSPASLELVEGQKAHFECTFLPRDDPNMHVIWLHNGKEILASSRLDFKADFGVSTLDITSANPEDTGTFTCRASNKKGEADVVANLLVTDDRGVVTSSIFSGEQAGSQSIEALEQRISDPGHRDDMVGRPNWAVQRKAD